jgi:hypothetical protein
MTKNAATIEDYRKEYYKVVPDSNQQPMAVETTAMALSLFQAVFEEVLTNYMSTLFNEETLDKVKELVNRMDEHEEWETKKPGWDNIVEYVINYDSTNEFLDETKAFSKSKTLNLSAMISSLFTTCVIGASYVVSGVLSEAEAVETIKAKIPLAIEQYKQL